MMQQHKNQIEQQQRSPNQHDAIQSQLFQGERYPMNGNNIKIAEQDFSQSNHNDVSHNLQDSGQYE